MAIGLGGNVGHPERAFARALAGLAPFVDGLVLSPLYRTAPVGGPPQPDFLNAVAVGRTRLAPLELLAVLQRLEAEAGRDRSAGPNAPRPLDLDLLLHGALRVDLPALVVPHPRLAERRFVLAPLADLRPALVVPSTGRTVASLLASAPPARVERVGALTGRELRPGRRRADAGPAARATRAGAARPRG